MTPVYVLLTGLGIFSSIALSNDSKNCFQYYLEHADGRTTLEEIRQRCQNKTNKPGFVIHSDPTGRAPTKTNDAEQSKKYQISSYQPNFILPFTYMDKPNTAPFDLANDDLDLDKIEFFFQISLKAPIQYNIFGSRFDLFYAYTSRSWWQAYNSDISSAFRETNYKPEFFIRSYDISLFKTHFNLIDFGFAHESNGRSEILSRSWNRFFISSTIKFNDALSFNLKAWHRFKESIADDDNPDIHHYLGYGELRAIFTPNKKHTFTALIKPGTQENGFELTWSRPLFNSVRLYAVYYKGYGESLLDYDHEMERLGIGITFNDFLQK